MSDPTVSTAVEPTITLDPSGTKPLASAPAPVQAPASEGKPAWLDERLEQARRAALKEAGFESLEDAKKAAEERTAQREAKKTESQKRAEAEAALKAAQDQAKEMTEALGVLAKSQMSALTEAQRNAVVAVAGDDPARQIKTIDALKSTWTGAAAPAAPAAPARPADTAPAPAAPKDGNASPPPDLKAVHAELKKTNPVLAARFAEANQLFNK